MDASAVNVNVSVDDFDSILSYSPDQAPWVTPDPFSADVNLETTPWWLGTYHRTEQVDASISLNFTGTLSCSIVLLSWSLTTSFRPSYLRLRHGRTRIWII